MTAAIMSAPAIRQYQFGKLLLLALLYFASGKLGLAFPTPYSHITLFWLPTGIAVATLLRWGIAYWPGIFLGALLLEFSLDMPLPVVLGITTGNTLAPLATVWLLKRWQFEVSFARQRDLLALFAAAALGMLLSASTGTSLLWLGGLLPSTDMPQAWLNWWLGDAVGVLLAGSMLLSFSRSSRDEFMRRPAESLLCLLLLGTVSWLVYFVNYGDRALPLAFLPLPMLIWAALRLGVTSTSLAVLLLSLLTAIGTAQGTGVFGAFAPEVAMYLAWLYMFTVVLIGLMVTTILGERSKTEERQRSSEELLRQTQSVARIGSWRLNLIRDELEWSDENYRIFGIPLGSKLNYKCFLDLVHPDDRAKVDSAWQASLKGGPYLVQHRIVVGGETRWIEERAQFDYDARGNAISGTGSTQDITEHKEVEFRQLDTLRELEEKEKSRARFLAAAGHDLRQPVAAANLFLDALKHTSPTPSQSELIDKLDQSMQIFSNQLGRLLDISKFDAGLIKPEIRTLDLTKVFNWLEQNFAQLALEKQLRFKFHFPLDKPLIVRTDIDLLESVLMNLVSNAIKFTSRGGILIGARQRKDSVLLQVWDTGIGIGETDLPHIFEEFFQVANPQRNRDAGLGLGLSIGQRAVTLLGSQIVCRSRLGRGSVFEFSLPTCSRDPDITARQTEAPIPAPINKNLFYGKNIVVLEDDELVANAQVSLLQGLNARARHFHNVEEALKHESDLDADYFIVDYSLGTGLTGYDFLKALQQKRPAPLKAVILTGETSSRFVAHFSDSPWPILHKPANLSQIISSLDKPD